MLVFLIITLALATLFIELLNSEDEDDEPIEPSQDVTTPDACRRSSVGLSRLLRWPVSIMHYWTGNWLCRCRAGGARTRQGQLLQSSPEGLPSGLSL